MVTMTKPQPLAGRKVLIVDDSSDITSLVADTFAAAGARSVAVHSGAEAMTCLVAGGFDVIVLDMVMPQPDGWSVLEFMRNWPESLRRTVVLTASRYDRRIDQRVQEYGVALLFKPFLLADLIETACRLT